MILAGHDVNEAFEPGDAAQHGVHTTVPSVDGHAGIMRMAGQPHLVFFSNQNHALQKIGNTLPVLVGIDWPSFSQGRLLTGSIINEGAVGRPAAPWSGLSAHDSANTKVIFQSRNAGLGRVADHLAEIVDLSI